MARCKTRTWRARKIKPKTFFKLSTTEGIGAVTKNEYNWNKEFNSQIKRPSSNYWVPKNYDCGIYHNNLFFLITDKLEGEFLAKTPAKSKISKLFISNNPKGIHHEIFLNKAKS